MIDRLNEVRSAFRTSYEFNLIEHVRLRTKNGPLPEDKEAEAEALGAMGIAMDGLRTLRYIQSGEVPTNEEDLLFS